MATRTALVAAALLGVSGTAQAHGIAVELVVDGTTVRGTARYSDQSPVANEPVRVFSPPEAADATATLTTAADGRFLFEAAAGRGYRFALDAGEGHEVERTVQVVGAAARPPAGSVAGAVAVGGLTREDLDKALLPLREDIAKLRSRWRVSDLVAALGYVLGIFGLLRWRAGR
jgi:nickel transport protein